MKYSSYLDINRDVVVLEELMRAYALRKGEAVIDTLKKPAPALVPVRDRQRLHLFKAS